MTNCNINFRSGECATQRCLSRTHVLCQRGLPTAMVISGLEINYKPDDEGRQSGQTSEHKAFGTASNLSRTSNLSPQPSRPTLPPTSPIPQSSPTSAHDLLTTSIPVY